MASVHSIGIRGTSMSGETISWVLYFGVVAFVVSLIVLSWPYRGNRTFTLSRLVAAPRETVWRSFHIDLEDPDNARFHGEIVSNETDPDDPSLSKQIIDTSGDGFRLTIGSLPARISVP